ncbi:MAG: hypothetical protein KAW46_12150, partial [candidate division Zixibacteria bacterium]|nr:hypothetical protein [candidate division Zixibacteria bacterium]
MRLKLVFIMAAMLVTASVPAFGQLVSVDHIDGLNVDNRLEIGVPIIYHIRLTGDGDTHPDIKNGFRVYSPDGATWGTTVADTTGTLGGAQFDGSFIISNISVTGSGADTVGFTGTRFFETGLPPGFDDVAYTVDIGPIAESELGKTICLDSAYYPPGGVWKWAGPDVFPNWDGPHCFPIGTPPPLPEIDCPGEPRVIDGCWGSEVCVALAISGAETVTVEGATWADGQLCFTADAAGSHQFHVVATNPFGSATCDVTVDVTINDAPTITCPDGPIVVTNLAEMICDGLPISNADQVTVTTDNQDYTATWEVNQICFNANINGSFTATVIASNACGADTCSILILVGEQPQAPVIDCPPDPDAVDGCWNQEVCVNLAITGADSVLVEGATWADGQLCFLLGPDKDVYSFRVIAT